MTEFQKKNRLDLIAALRSGEFAQDTTGLFRTDHGYSCLGVGCQVFLQDTQQGYWREDHAFVPKASPIVSAWPYETHEYYKWPYEVVQYYGFEYDDVWSFMHMNERKFTFDEIADAMELLTLAEL